MGSLLLLCKGEVNGGGDGRNSKTEQTTVADILRTLQADSSPSASNVTVGNFQLLVCS